MQDETEVLRQFKPAHPYFIGIDSDGCVFDSMEIKHKECFVPAYIKHFGLQPISKFAREAWEFVNLYSKTRGVNRFPALVRALDLLRERKQVRERHAVIPKTDELQAWIGRESKLGNASLAAEVAGGNAALAEVKEWSDAVNRAVEDIVKGVPPFPQVPGSLENLSQRADAMVISQTPVDALSREWDEHGITSYVKAIAGQEMGTKTEHLQLATQGKYEPDHVLMIGDAPGDKKAADANQAFFYPIIPGREEASWQRFHDEALERFLTGKFDAAYQKSLNEEFDSGLPENPPWS